MDRSRLDAIVTTWIEDFEIDCGAHAHDPLVSHLLDLFAEAESPALGPILAAIGWQGGTVEQVVAEVKRMAYRQTIEAASNYDELSKLAAWLKEEFEVSPEGSDPWFRLAIAITDNGYQPLGQDVSAILPEHGESKR